MLSKFLTTKHLGRWANALLILTLALFFLLFSKPIQAFSSQTVKGGYLLNFESAVFKTEEMNLQSFVNETFKAVGGSIFTSLIGCLSCTEKEREKYPGLIVTIGNLMAGIYASPPASGVQYLAHLGNKLGVVQPAYAQEEHGYGFRAMEKIRPIWTAFRNISYIFFVLILVFAGFAIMFRVKISPQAVITIQSALPRIVIALILVTFSYAIVGFMIDLMYVFTGLITNIFIGAGGIISTRLSGVPGIGEALAVLPGLAESLVGSSPAGIAVANGIFFPLATLLTLLIALVIGPVAWLITLIAAVLIFVAIIRCFWTLLKAYAMIIVNLIFAPFQILVGVLPGSDAMGSWFRNLVANIAVLPAMIAMFYIASYLILSGVTGIFGDAGVLITTILTGWVVTAGLGFAFGSLLVTTGIVSPWAFFILLILPFAGLMILFMAPKVSNMIQSFIAGKPFEYGTAIGEAMGPVTAAYQFGYGAGKFEAGRKLMVAPPGILTRIPATWREAIAKGVLGYKP